MQGVSKMRFQTKACIAGLKTLLMFFNVALWATGMTIVILGIWMKLSLSKFFDISTQYPNFALPGLFIATGVIMILVGFFACSCTAKGQPRALYSYGVFLIIIFIIVMSGAITGYAYRRNLQESFHSGLQNAVHDYGRNDLLERDIDRIQKLLTCCGANGYQDFFNTTFSNGTESVPSSCCRPGSNCPPRTEVTPESVREIYTIGCYDEIVTFLSDKLETVGVIAIVVSLCQLFGAFLSFLLAKYINKGLYETLT